MRWGTAVVTLATASATSTATAEETAAMTPAPPVLKVISILQLVVTLKLFRKHTLPVPLVATLYSSYDNVIGKR